MAFPIRPPQSGDAEDVVRGDGEGEVESHTLQSTESGFPHATDGLQPSKDGLDSAAHMDAHGIARMAGRATIDGRTLPLPGHMRGDIPISQVLDQAMAVITLVSPQSDPLRSAQFVDHEDGGIDLCRTIGRGHQFLGNEAMPIAHEDVPQIGEP